ncbi:hypothetical protein AALA80_05035 [Oscillospiraceae bacterium 50-60]
MNQKQKKELRRRLSTRQLMGIDQLTDHGLKTARGELVFYLVSPDNLSVLSAEGVRGRVRALTELLRGMEAVELLALDSRESFQSNKHHYQARLEQEDLPALWELLRQDMGHLDEIQSTTASAREFALVYRREEKSSIGVPARAQRSGSRGERSRSGMSELSPQGGSEGYGVCGDDGHLKQIEKRICDCGFHVRMAEEQDMMRLLAVYYQQDVTTEQFDHFDGERSANG